MRIILLCEVNKFEFSGGGVFSLNFTLFIPAILRTTAIMISKPINGWLFHWHRIFMYFESMLMGFGFIFIYIQNKLIRKILYKIFKMQGSSRN